MCEPQMLTLDSIATRAMPHQNISSGEIMNYVLVQGAHKNKLPTPDLQNFFGISGAGRGAQGSYPPGQNAIHFAS